MTVKFLKILNFEFFFSKAPQWYGIVYLLCNAGMVARVEDLYFKFCYMEGYKNGHSLRYVISKQPLSNEFHRACKISLTSSFVMFLDSWVEWFSKKMNGFMDGWIEVKCNCDGSAHQWRSEWSGFIQSFPSALCKLINFYSGFHLNKIFIFNIST